MRRNPLRPEVDALLSASTQARCEVLSAIVDDVPKLLEFYVHPFASDEFYPPSLDADEEGARHDIAYMRHGSATGIEKVLQLARAAGRLLGGAFERDLVAGHPYLAIRGQTVTIPSIGYEYALPQPPQSVIEWGMGVSGLFAHTPNLKRRAYQLTAVQLEPGEAALLEGVAERLEVGGSPLRILAGGIARVTDEMIRYTPPPQADLLIASRVGSAGEQLDYGISHCADLLAMGGFLVVGGRVREGGRPYHRIAPLLAADPKLRMVADVTSKPSIVIDGEVVRSMKQERVLVAERVA